MSKRKQSRRQRAAAAKVAATTGAAQQPTKRSLQTDRQALLSMYLWAIGLTFGYGVANNLLLDRPEQQVSKEAVAVCILTLAVRIGLFYTRPALVASRNRLSEWILDLGRRLDRRRFVRVAGVAILGMVMAIGATPASLVEASLVKILQNERLPEGVRQAATQQIAYLQGYSTFRRIAASDPAALSPQRQLQNTPAVQGRPGMVGQGMDKSTIILGPQAAGFAYTHPFPMFFSDFTVVSFVHDPSLPIPQFLIKEQGSSLGTVINNVKVGGLAQDIGNLTWTNDVFENSLIRYDGGPLSMANVVFINCTFEREHLPMGGTRIFLDYLATHQGEPVNAYFPPVRR